MLVAGCSLVALTVAVLQTAVVPILGVIDDQLGASPVAVSWAVTANLLAAAAATPLLGRLADVYRKKRVLLAVLAIVLAGSVLAATTSSLTLLIVARVMQGVSFALYPICVAILREELPEARINRALAVLSATLGFGGGTGLVVTGLLMGPGAGYHRVFWLATGFTAAVMVTAAIVVPSRPRRSAGSIDWLGAIGLAGGLSAVLVAVTQGNTWGWGSPATLGCLGAGAAMLVCWWWWERRVAQPLVSLEMLTRPAMLLTNLATVLVGMGLYFGFLGLTQFVQVPPEIAGYGFGAGVLEASVVYLLPGALAGLVTALVSGRYIDRYGARPVLVTGALAGIAGFSMLAVLHTLPWQVIVAGILTNGYISLAYGALPALVVREVEPGETGITTSMNAIARTVGSSVAAALVAVLLGHGSAAGSDIPAEGGFVVIFVLGAVTAAVATVLIAVTKPRPVAAAAPDAEADSRAMNHEWG